MHSLNGMAERFRARLEAPGVIELPGCYDALSALLLEEAGFGAVFLSGYGAAASSAANPDIGLTTLSETAAMARSIARAIDVPLVVDADNGYGDEDSAVRTVLELEEAGAAAMILEDQELPKRCGHDGAPKRVVPLDQYLRKLERAMKARRTPLVIIARTDAPILDEAIMRARAFHAAGADAVLIDGLPSLEAVRRVAEEVPGHRHINLIFGGRTPLLSADELHRIGFKIVMYSTPALFVAVHALRKQMKTLAATHDLRSLSSESARFIDVQSMLVERYLARGKTDSRRTEAAAGGQKR